MTDPHSHKILILDFGSQFTQLIARRVREAGVYCEIYPFDITADEIRAFAPRGIILSGIISLLMIRILLTLLLTP